MTGTASAVIGLQWGDEAKGKIVDILTDEHDVAVRYQGGNNAGHTVRFHGETYKLSLLPTGVLRPEVTSVIAAGCVVNPAALLKEMDSIRERGVPVGKNLRISDRAHVVMPYHMLEEAALERSRSGEKIGTTMRGIGTCYRDKAGRTHAIRIGDLYHRDLLRSRLTEIVAHKNALLAALDPDAQPVDADATFAACVEQAERLRPHVCDSTAYLHREYAAGKRILFEGAQGSLLDIDHGTFPYVTSSNSSGCGLHSGSGFPERWIAKIIGVAKAYTTRVGGGPFPTELPNDVGEHIRRRGNEYGTVTGRPRRCGWFDAVATAYGARISGVDRFAIALLDVLDELDEIRLCEAYELDGERTTEFPSHVEDLARVKPIFRTFRGWKTDTTGVRKLVDLPPAARAYVDAVTELLGVKLAFVSVGPDREQTIDCGR